MAFLGGGGCLLSAGSSSRCQHQPGLGQAEQIQDPGTPSGWQRIKHLVHPLLLSQVYWQGVGQDVEQLRLESVLMGCQHRGWWLNQLYNASPSRIFLHQNKLILKKPFMHSLIKAEKQGRHIFHSLVYFSNACNSQDWAVLKLGACNSIQAYLGGRNPITSRCHHSLPGPASARNWSQEVTLDIELRYSDRRNGILTAKCLSLNLEDFF